VREALRSFHGRKVGDLIKRVIQRPDEINELLALYWKDDPKQPLAAQLKLGLARASQKFNEYQFKKWTGGSGEIKVRDAIFLSHPKAKNDEVGSLFARYVNKTFIPAEIAEKYGLDPSNVGLESAETWENKLSRGEDKRETFETLIDEGKLGALALLRNLRGMVEAGVPDDKIRKALNNIKVERVLPFRFISAARHAMKFEPQLELAMLKCIEGHEKLSGTTVLLVDVSGSMASPVSGKSEISRLDAACGLAMLAREVCESVRIFTFSYNTVEVPPRRGFALRDAIVQSQPHGGTDMASAVATINKNVPCDRLIMLTDEQATGPYGSRVSNPRKDMKAYCINVASYQNGVGYGAWNHVDGWSEAVLDYIQMVEKFD